MNIKETLAARLDDLHTLAYGTVDAVFVKLDELLDALPDEPVGSEKPSTEAMAEALATFAEEESVPGAADNYRSGLMPDYIVEALYRSLISFRPDLAVKTEGSKEKTPQEYINYLKENFPTMAKVYEQSIRNQARKDNASHRSETEYPDGTTDFI